MPRRLPLLPEGDAPRPASSGRAVVLGAGATLGAWVLCAAAAERLAGGGLATLAALALACAVGGWTAGRILLHGRAAVAPTRALAAVPTRALAAVPTRALAAVGATSGLLFGVVVLVVALLGGAFRSDRAGIAMAVLSLVALLGCGAGFGALGARSARAGLGLGKREGARGASIQ